MASNPRIVKGATARVLVQLYQTPSASGPVQDLTGAAITVLDVPSGMPVPEVVAVTPATNGQFRLVWTKEQSERLRIGNAAYYVKLAVDFPSTDREVIVRWFDVVASGGDDEGLIEIFSMGVAGPPGDEPFVFIQSSPSATWVVNHNRGYPVSATVLNSGSIELLAQVVYVNNNQLQVLFASPQTGSVRVK